MLKSALLQPEASTSFQTISGGLSMMKSAPGGCRTVQTAVQDVLGQQTAVRSSLGSKSTIRKGLDSSDNIGKAWTAATQLPGTLKLLFGAVWIANPLSGSLGQQPCSLRRLPNSENCCWEALDSKRRPPETLKQ
ncbi:hypothetical protein KFK09_004871 [Dendrobium nobile]|uniref:Uncharacterized protein n=1 Tax=Dendrobium nobile TaxID=94219 RepID=A0A8T3BWM5_DENNO|nr:hypothetical protein KFK09_004871 [Dendrobium nobile]